MTLLSRPGDRLRFAFTLLEVLVVTAVMALLAALLLPVLAQSRENARGAACSSNLRQIGVAFRAYVDDFDGLYPLLPLNVRVETDTETDEADEVEGPLEWHEAIEPYHANNEPVFRCPSDPSPAEFFEMSYALSGSFVMGLHESAISYPAATVLAGDRRNTIRNQDQPALFAWWQWQGGLWPPAAVPDPTPAATNDLALERHRGRLNLLFVDGHVRHLAFSATWGAGSANQYWPQRP